MFDKIHGIVVSGHPSEQELADGWADLLIQYGEAMGNAESRLLFSLHKQILQKEITLYEVEHAIFILRQTFMPELLEFLNGVFFSKVVIDGNDIADRERKLNVFNNQKASIKMAIDLKRVQYNSLKKKKNAAGEKPDLSYFQTILLNLSDFAKYEVTDKITVFQFCERFRRLTKFLDSVK